MFIILNQSINSCTCTPSINLSDFQKMWKCVNFTFTTFHTLKNVCNWLSVLKAIQTFIPSLPTLRFLSTTHSCVRTLLTSIYVSSRAVPHSQGQQNGNTSCTAETCVLSWPETQLLLLLLGLSLSPPLFSLVSAQTLIGFLVAARQKCLFSLLCCSSRQTERKTCEGGVSEGGREDEREVWTQRQMEWKQNEQQWLLPEPQRATNAHLLINRILRFMMQLDGTISWDLIFDSNIQQIWPHFSIT